MNNEMMLFQARQDFIDMHADLLAGRQISFERYEKISWELKRMDDINFEWMLHAEEKESGIPLARMWEEISKRVNEWKQNGEWESYKGLGMMWKDGLYLREKDSG